ncbi:MAG: lactonase family protein [Spirochaetales bacterium]|nr:lactonase family protein [Spirochaetales bacterium]
MFDNLYAIGTYTNYVSNAPYAKGKGIVLCSMDVNSNTLKVKDIFSKTISPTYLTFDYINKILYAIEETEEGRGLVSSYNIKDEKIIQIHSLLLETDQFCHIDLNDDILVLSSYNSGLISLVSTKNGKLSFNMSYKYSGSSINKDRQEGSHAHQAIIDSKSSLFFVSDLGTDKIWIHDLSSSNLEPINHLNIPEGYGPRHLVIHNNDYVYILCELVPKIVIAKLDRVNKSLQITGEIDSINNANSTISAPAAIKIHPSNKTLAVSNRFDDTIAVFSIEPRNNSGKLTLVSEFKCMGKTPREITFTPNGDSLIIANQDSDDIQLMGFNTATGEPNNIWGKPLALGTPVSVVPLF